MPDYAPNPDAPENYWAGEYDAQQLANSIGMSWTAPLWALSETRVVNIATLCSSAPPSAPEFTTTDMALAFNPFSDSAPLRVKLQQFTDNYLHRTFCTAVDAPPLDPVPYQPPPADLPPNPPPVKPDEQRTRDMYRWMYWMATEFVPRTYEAGDSTTVSGTGFWPIGPRTDGEWSRDAVGVEVTVDAKPDYAGRSNGGDYPVYYDLGWYSLDCARGTQSPIRLQHVHQITAASKPGVTGFFYNLPPGVEITVTALYPNLPSPPDGDA